MNLRCILSALVAFASLAPARAQTIVTSTWIGTDPYDARWDDPSNWSNGIVPENPNATVRIQNGFGPIISGTAQINLDTLLVGAGTNSVGTLTVTDDAWLTVTGTLWMGYYANDNATLTLSGNSNTRLPGVIDFGLTASARFTGLVTDHARLNFSSMRISYAGTGTNTLTINGNADVFGASLQLGRDNNSIGALTVAESATLTLTTDLNVGLNRGNGFVNVMDNAVVDIRGNTIIGFTAASTGQTSRSYVSVSGNASFSTVGLIVGNYHTGTLSVSNHALVTTNNLTIGLYTGTGSVIAGGGSVLLNGNELDGRGVLAAPNVRTGDGGGTIIFDGGILRATTSTNAFINTPTGTRTLTLQLNPEGAYIDSYGHDIGIADGVIIAGSGAFNKIGAGSLTLSNTPAYTGATVIHEGDLILTLPDQIAASQAVTILENTTIRAASADQTLNALSGAGSVNLDNATLTINSNFDTTFSGEIIAAGGLIKTGPGALTLNGYNTLGSATLSGGVLGIGSASALGDGIVTINDPSASLRGDATVTIANSIRALDTPLMFDALDGVTLTVNGPVSGTLGIVKEGSGAINLINDTTALSGLIDIHEGALYVAGLGAGSTVTVADGATFGGYGIVNAPVAYAAIGNLQIGSAHDDSLVNTPSTLTIADTLTLGHTTIKFDLHGNGQSDKLIADTILFGSQTGIDFATFRQGTYTLIQTTVDTLPSALPTELAVNTTRTGFDKSDRENFTYALSDAGKTLTVTIDKTNESLSWAGAASDTWDYNNTASWAGNATTFIDGDRVTFAAASSGTITIDGNNVTAADMTISTAGNLTFTGGGRITTDAASSGGKGASFGADATGKFTMQGTGTVTFDNASNVFLGGVYVDSGAVIGNADSLGKNADITNGNNGSVIFRQDNNNSFTGRLHGTGYYAKTGSGALTLTAGDSTLTGTFDVLEGSLLLATGAKLDNVAIANGATFGGAGAAEDAHASGNATVRVGVAIAGAQVGTETLTLRSLTLADAARIIGAGTLATNITIAPGCTGIADIAENREITLAGSLGGSGGFTKQGPGGFVLTQPSTYSGATTVAAGALKVAAPNLLSASSSHIIKPAGSLNLNGYDQTIHSLVNEGKVIINAPGTVGARLTLANGYIGAAGSVISMSLRAADNTPTLADQIVIQAGDIAQTGGAASRTTIRVNVDDLRADPNAFEAYLNDIPALIIHENGKMPANVFTVTDGTSANRVVIGMHDYRLYYFENEARLVATDSAEVPAVLAINPISLAVNRATLNSVAQRLDRLRDIQTAGDNQNRDKHLWLQGYYRNDRFYDNRRSNTSGMQAGFDIPTNTSTGGTVIYGIFADYTNSKIEIADVFNRPSITLDSKSLGAYLALQHENWSIDFVAKHTWDDYTINVTDTPEFSTTGASWGGFARLSYALALKNGWTLVPQTQLVFQARGVNDAKDAYGRTYTFGQKYARIDESNSLEGRISLSARRLVTLKNGKVLQPWITFGYYNEFKGDMTVTTLNNYNFPVPLVPYHDDMGGSSFQLNIGTSAQLSKHFTVIIDAAIQNGGKIDSYSFNAGLNYRW